MNDNEFLLLAADLVEVDLAGLSLDDSLAAIGWDSLANVEFIAEADARCGVTVDAQELADSRTLRDVRALLSAGK